MYVIEWFAGIDCIILLLQILFYGNVWVTRSSKTCIGGKSFKYKSFITIVHFQVPGTQPFKTLILHARLRTSHTLPLFFIMTS